MVLIIGFTGRAGAGKDTAASLIEPRVHNLAFAKPLKDAAKILFNFTDEQLYDPVKKEEVDPKWGKSPREILQWLGTDVLRNHISKDFFLINMENRIKEIEKENIAITDVRFNNEAELIHKKGGIIIKIERPFAEGSGTEHTLHPTELGISSKLVDYTITNDSTIEELKIKLEKILKVAVSDVNPKNNSIHINKIIQTASAGGVACIFHSSG